MRLFGRNKAVEVNNRRAPLTDPAGDPLAPREQPGYYPGYSVLSQQRYWEAATRKLVLKRVETNNQPHAYQFFKPHEVETMLAVVDRILPQDDRTPDRRIAILPRIDERLALNHLEGYRYEDMPPDQDAYRIAAEAFDEMAETLYERPFHQLTTLEQETLLKQVHDAEPKAAEQVWKRLSIERFWTMLVSDVSAAYYAHPWAWDEVGFGGPAYPRGYMRLEDGEAEPWEVDEQPYAWVAPMDTLSDAEEAHGTGQEHQTHQGQGGTH